MIKSLTRERKRPLGVTELIAIALGGMVGGGIFAILGVSVEFTPALQMYVVGWALLPAQSNAKLLGDASWSSSPMLFPTNHFPELFQRGN